MIKRTITTSLLLLSFACGQAGKTERIQKGDPISKVYTVLGTPEVEYPLDGQLVQKYKRCTIISAGSIVVSAEYDETVQALPDTTENDTPPTIEEVRARAIKGEADSQYLLAYCFQFGKAVEQDYTKAINWYKRSAMQGYMPAQHNLGYLYMTGTGTDKDYTQAYMWALLAAENGNDKIRQALDYRISEEQKQAAEKLLQELKPRMKIDSSHSVPDQSAVRKATQSMTQ